MGPSLPANIANGCWGAQAMKSDVQFWTDYAVGRCVKKSVSPEEGVWYGLRCYIAQLMAYYRRSIPAKWEDVIDEGVASQFVYDIADRMRGEVLFGVPIDIPEDEFYAALSDTDLSQPPQLSPRAWQMVKEVSGASREEWELILENVRAALAKHVTCPKCYLSGRISDIAVLVAAPDPFTRASSLALHFKCEWCGTDLTLDTTVKGLEMTDKRWLDNRGRLFWFWVAGFVVAFAGFLWLLKLK